MTALKTIFRYLTDLPCINCKSSFYVLHERSKKKIMTNYFDLISNERKKKCNNKMYHCEINVVLFDVERYFLPGFWNHAGIMSDLAAEELEAAFDLPAHWDVDGSFASAGAAFDGVWIPL